MLSRFSVARCCCSADPCGNGGIYSPWFDDFSLNTSSKYTLTNCSIDYSGDQQLKMNDVIAGDNSTTMSLRMEKVNVPDHPVTSITIEVDFEITSPTSLDNLFASMNLDFGTTFGAAFVSLGFEVNIDYEGNTTYLGPVLFPSDTYAGTFTAGKLRLTAVHDTGDNYDVTYEVFDDGDVLRLSLSFSTSYLTPVGPGVEPYFVGCDCELRLVGQIQKAVSENADVINETYFDNLLIDWTV